MISSNFKILSAGDLGHVFQRAAGSLFMENFVYPKASHVHGSILASFLASNDRAIYLNFSLS